MIPADLICMGKGMAEITCLDPIRAIRQVAADGDVSNTAIAFAKQGDRATVVSAVVEDPFGQF